MARFHELQELRTVFERVSILQQGHTQVAKHITELKHTAVMATAQCR